LPLTSGVKDNPGEVGSVAESALVRSIPSWPRSKKKKRFPAKECADKPLRHIFERPNAQSYSSSPFYGNAPILRQPFLAIFNPAMNLQSRNDGGMKMAHIRGTGRLEHASTRYRSGPQFA